VGHSLARYPTETPAPGSVAAAQGVTASLVVSFFLKMIKEATDMTVTEEKKTIYALLAGSAVMALGTLMPWLEVTIFTGATVNAFQVRAGLFSSQKRAGGMAPRLAQTTN
jgi:hypothetical protein